MFSSIAHSQNATQDSVVVLPKWMAVEVLKDLERLDQCDSNMIYFEKKLDIQARELGLQDRIILGQQEQIANLNEIIINKESIIIVNDKEVAYWRKQFRKQKRKKIIVGVVGLAVVALAVISN